VGFDNRGRRSGFWFRFQRLRGKIFACGPMKQTPKWEILTHQPPMLQTPVWLLMVYYIQLLYNKAIIMIPERGGDSL
jgi:hypothetical protein